MGPEGFSLLGQWCHTLPFSRTALLSESLSVEQARSIEATR
jgi:hypothetical protein